MTDRDSEFTAYYAARGAVMRNTAYLLCGNWHLAEDLTQTAFAKLYGAWARMSRKDAMDACTRRVLVRAFLDERRRPWRREHPVAADTAALGGAVSTSDTDVSMDLRDALGAVPPRQRAVLVVRLWADLSVEQTADVLNCSAAAKARFRRG